MGLFSFTQEVAIDLGTANTIITCNDKMVVDEPSVIALDARSDKVLAVGKVAREMYEKTHPNIRTVRPLREGVYRGFLRCRANDSRLYQDGERKEALVRSILTYGDWYPFW